MYKDKFLDLIKKVPAGVWLLAFGLSLQFSPVLTYRIKGGGVICAIYALGMFLCQSRYCREGFLGILGRAMRGNGGKCILLGVFYMMAVAAWFYAPYEIGYNDIRHIWKKMLLNILAIIIGLFLSQRRNFIKTITILCLPVALFQAGLLNDVVAAEGLEARYYLGEGEGGGFLGTFNQWEPIAMLSVMLVGLLMGIENKVLKIVLGAMSAFLSWTVLRAGYATPFALLLIGFGMLGVGYLRFGSSRKTNVGVKIVVSCLFLIGAASVFYKIAISFESGNWASESIAARFSNMMKDPMGGGYDAEHSRFNLMKIGWKSFCDSPIFGRGGEYPSPRYETSGGHHSLVDYLGMYGIVGGGAYVLFVILTLRCLFKRYKLSHDWFDNAKLAVGIMFFIGGIVNPGWMDLPMSCYLIFCAPFENQSENARNLPSPFPPPPPRYWR